jgi:hypothetical protein
MKYIKDFIPKQLCGYSGEITVTAQEEKGSVLKGETVKILSRYTCFHI